MFSQKGFVGIEKKSSQGQKENINNDTHLVEHIMEAFQLNGYTVCAVAVLQIALFFNKIELFTPRLVLLLAFDVFLG